MCNKEDDNEAGHDHEAGDMVDHGDHDGPHGAHTHGHHDLVKLEDVTHTAICSGSWFDPDTWDSGTVPATGANVLIPVGTQVLYDSVSEERIDTIRIEGELSFATSKDTKLIVDTVVGMGGSKFTIGTADNPVEPNVKTDIIFAAVDPTNAVLSRAEDPDLIGRGLITDMTAEVSIHGGQKTAKTTLADAAMAGDTSLTFSDIPADWLVGDTIVLTGTRYNRDGTNADNTMFEDEVLTITGIDGDTITFNHRDVSGNALRFDHVPPEIDGHDFDIYVANLSRPVTFSTENWKTAEIGARGHTMFMGHDVHLEGIALHGMGRTDKAFLQSDDNPSGRYPIHLHRPMDNPDDDGVSKAVIQHNAVWDSPGWAYTIHGARAEVRENVSFDVTGAHFVTEDGDEQAYFFNNIAIKSTGDIVDPAADLLEPLKSERGRLDDLGVEGMGFWFQSSYSIREFDGNIAASMRDAGVKIYGHHDHIKQITTHPNIDIALLKPEHQALFLGYDTVPSWLVPVSDFTNFTVYNSARDGVVSLGVTRDNGDGDFGLRNFDIQNIYEGIEAWGIEKVGFRGNYSSNHHIKDAIFIGSPTAAGQSSSDIHHRNAGVEIGKFSRNSTIENVRAENFDIGIYLPQQGGQGLESQDPTSPTSYVIGGLFQNNTQNIGHSTGRIGDSPRTPNINEDLETPNEINPLPIYVSFVELPTIGASARGSNVEPVADFEIQGKGGMSVDFDGSLSFDPDVRAVITTIESIGARKAPYDVYDNVHVSLVDDPYGTGGNVLAAYRWDWNSDGIYDDFGRFASHTFTASGAHEVTLQVMDIDGGVSTVTKTVTVANDPTQNVIVNGDFSDADELMLGSQKLNTADFGWHFGDGAFSWNAAGEYMQRPQTDQIRPLNLGQYIFDQAETRGVQTFSFDAYRSSDQGSLQVQVFGIDGAFKTSVWDRARDDVAGYLDYENRIDLLVQDLDIGDGAFGWSNFTFEADLGAGYEYIYVRFLAHRPSGDYGIDNVFLGGGQANESTLTSDMVASETVDVYRVVAGDHAISGFLPGEDRLDLRDVTNISVSQDGSDAVVSFTGSDAEQGAVTLTDVDALDLFDALTTGGQQVGNVRYGTTANEVFIVDDLAVADLFVFRFEAGIGNDQLDLSNVLIQFDPLVDNIDNFVSVSQKAQGVYEISVNEDGLPGGSFDLAATLVLDIPRLLDLETMIADETLVW
jgi:hypothetical protein